MKKRGEDLSKHYAQVERYWMRITPNRPRYAMLCNFDEFWLFDFENQVDEPVDKISLEQLPERSGALTSMEIGGMRPVFHNNQVEVTDRSARRLGKLCSTLFKGRNSDMMLVTLFCQTSVLLGGFVRCITLTLTQTLWKALKQIFV